MNSSKIALQISAANPDHHLWNNNGTWWCHYTVHPTPLTKQRIHVSLRTKDLAEARLRRDQVLVAGRRVLNALKGGKSRTQFWSL